MNPEQPKPQTKSESSTLPQKVQQVEIFNWKAHPIKTLQGHFSASWPNGWTVHNLAFHEKGEDRWINPPSRPMPGANGQTIYVDVIEFSPIAKQKFKVEVLAALDRYFEAEGR